MLPLHRRLRRAVPPLIAAALALGVAPTAFAAPAGDATHAATGAAAAADTARTTVLVNGPAAAVRRAEALLSHSAGFTALPVIGGFSARVTAAERAALVAVGLTVTTNAPAQVEDADWGAGSHDASAVYPQVDGATKAWAQGIDGRGVTVALVDTGINNTGLAALKPLQKLERIELFRTRGNDEGVAALAELKNLSVAKLDYMTLDDKAVPFLQSLPKLRELSLDATSITDQGLQGLQSINGLRALNVYHTLVTEKGMSALRSALPECKVVFDRDSALPTRRIKQ